MTPAARTQAAIELLDQIVLAARDGGSAADTLTAKFFAARRYAGSKDKRAIRELVYAAIRACGERPESGRAAMLALAEKDEALRATFDGSNYGPGAVAEDGAISSADEQEARVNALMVARAGERVLLADASKFGHRLTYRVARVDGMRVVTEARLDAAWRRRLGDLGCDMALAEVA